MTKVFIKRIEETTARTEKTYWKTETDQGNMNIFDKDIAKEIEKNVPGDFDVNIQVKGNFKNIIGLGEVEPIKTEKVPSDSPKTAPKTSQKETSDEVLLTCIGYAKDLAVAGKIEASNVRSESIALLAIYESLKEKEKN